MGISAEPLASNTNSGNLRQSCVSTDPVSCTGCGSFLTGSGHSQRGMRCRSTAQIGCTSSLSSSAAPGASCVAGWNCLGRCAPATLIADPRYVGRVRPDPLVFFFKVFCGLMVLACLVGNLHLAQSFGQTRTPFNEQPSEHKIILVFTLISATNVESRNPTSYSGFKG
jgi:hypothetical protein